MAILDTGSGALTGLRREGSAVINRLDSGLDLLLRTDAPLDAGDRTRIAAFAETHGLPRIAHAIAKAHKTQADYGDTLADASNTIEAAGAASPLKALVGGLSTATKRARRETAVLEKRLETSNKEIARELNLSEPTVKLHVKMVCRKLEARNRTHAAMLAKEAGFC